MMPSSLVLKIIGFSVLAIVLANLLAPAIGQTIWDFFYKPKKKKNSDIDFDILIEQKKSILRGGNPSSTGQTAGPTKTKSRTEELVHASYKKLSASTNRTSEQESQYLDLKKFMGLLDSIQWGGGKDFQQLASTLTNKVSVKITEGDISFYFQRLLSRDIYITSSGKIHSFEEISSLIELWAFYDNLLKSDALIKLLARRFSTGELEVKRGLCVFFKKAQRKDSEKLQIKVLTSPSPELPPAESPFLYGLLKERSGQVVKRAEIISSIREEVDFFKTLAPLPNLKNKKDLEGALAILGLKKGAKLEQIKKQYKSLAKQKHPDRLKGKGIPAEFESIATENFTRIQVAYDILSSELKDSD